MNVKKKTTIEKISESRKSTLYSISFEKDGTTEFEKFVAEFEKNATFNKDYQRIIAAFIEFRYFKINSFYNIFFRIGTIRTCNRVSV